ncbi:MAG: virulence RhuM family protein [Phycisphaerae bacterium]|nr:virulence RhuM family protein [Phycisphaerae bacterium]
MANNQTPNVPDRPHPPEGQILIYRDGALNLQVRLDGQTAWLPQRLIAELYQITVPTVSEHLTDIYEEGELGPQATIRKFRIVQREGTRDVSRMVDHYNLDAILAVGYRVRSLRGTQFRQWATARLSELLVKGFTLDDERIKAGRTIGRDYFDELLERIRDIRASERLFYQKITDIYATSIDYDPNAQISQTFFATVQNKLHWAIHGRTAAEIIHERADADKPRMGLTTWKNAPHAPIRKADVTVAKNYLNEQEISELNRIVSMYLDYAEDQAGRHHPMHMAEWVKKLDAFLRFNERNILTHAGKISHELAHEHAQEQFDRYEQKRLADAAGQPTSDFDKLVDRSKQMEKQLPPPKRARSKKAKKKSPKSRRGRGRGRG